MQGPPRNDLKPTRNTKQTKYQEKVIPARARPVRPSGRSEGRQPPGRKGGASVGWQPHRKKRFPERGRSSHRAQTSLSSPLSWVTPVTQHVFASKKRLGSSEKHLGQHSCDAPSPPRCPMCEALSIDALYIVALYIGRNVPVQSGPVHEKTRFSIFGLVQFLLKNQTRVWFLKWYIY